MAMPRFVCDDCDAVFDSREALQDHREECDADGSGRASVRATIERVQGLSRRQALAIVGAVLMGTLFLGPVAFASSLGGGGGGGDAPTGPRQETNPPVGYTVQTAADIPQITQDDLPNGTVADHQLSDAVQLNLLTGSATGAGTVLLQYSCTDCQEVRDGLASIADRFNGGQSWVFVAPYRDMDATIALTAFQRKVTMDAVNTTRIETFICTSLRQQPVECALRGSR